jgi:glycosyltransferase involved in cell wall biosynthesis
MASKQIRIAIFASHPIQYKIPLYRGLFGLINIDIRVFFYSDRGLVRKQNLYHDGVPAWDIPLLEGYKSEFLPNLVDEENWKIPFIQPFFNPAVINRLQSGDYDAIIIHSYLYPSDWLAFWAAKREHIKVLFYGDMYPRHPLSIGQRFVRSLLHKRMIHGADACLAIGSLARQVFLEEYGVPDSRIFLAPYTVDNTFFVSEVDRQRSQKDQIKAELGISPQDLVVLCVAGMVTKKRQPDLVEALAKLNRPCQLILVGHGPLLEQVREVCRQLLPNTLLPGFVNQSELPRYYAIADIFVLPSHWEEFGLVVNEAMCARLPVITSDRVAAAFDLVREGENGFTFPAGNISALTEKMDYLLTNPDVRIRFGQRSFEIIQDWNVNRTVEGIVNALQYTLAQKGSR